LHWPEEEFAKYLNVRMKSLASEMISKCSNCTYQCFDQFMQRSRKSTDYILPSEICVMINVIFSSKARAKLAAGDAAAREKLDGTMDTMLKDMETCIQDKMIGVLEMVLSKLARYDEVNPLGTLLAMAPKPNALFNKMKNLVGDQSGTASTAPSPQKQKTPAGQAQNTEQLGNNYVTFMRSCSEQLRQIVTDELWVNALFEHWYDGQMELINSWLTERLQQSLSHYQLTCISFIVKKLYSDFELHGIDDERLNGKTHKAITRRLQLEETNSALQENGHATGGSSLPSFGNASQAVSSMGNMVGGAQAKVFSLFR